MTTTENGDYSKEYSEQSFWDKVKKVAKVAGLKVIYIVLILYYTLQDPDVPLKAKAIITGALGYFILPFDLVPDPTVVGYADDFALLFWSLIQVAMYINPTTKEKAKEKLKDWFGEINLDEINEIDKKIDNPENMDLTAK